MTKLRAPATFEQALLRIIGLIGWDGAARATGKSESMIRRWSNPDDPREISYSDALRLDVAYAAAGGSGAPMHESYSVRLQVDAATAMADQEMLAAKMAEIIKEDSEAQLAILQATRPGATHTDRLIAQREVKEAMVTYQSTLSLLGAGPGGEGACLGEGQP